MKIKQRYRSMRLSSGQIERENSVLAKFTNRVGSMTKFLLLTNVRYLG